MAIIIPPNAPAHLVELQENLKEIFMTIAGNDAESLVETLPGWSFVVSQMKIEHAEAAHEFLTNLSPDEACKKYEIIMGAYSRDADGLRRELFPRLATDAQEAVLYAGYRDIITSLDKMALRTGQKYWASAAEALHEARMIKDLMMDVFQARGHKMGNESDLYIGLLGAVTVAEHMIKVFQFHMLSAAPAEVVRAVWAAESETVRYVYAPLMRKFADARGDAGIIQIVAELTQHAPQPSADEARLIKLLGPKR